MIALKRHLLSYFFPTIDLHYILSIVKIHSIFTLSKYPEVKILKNISFNKFRNGLKQVPNTHKSGKWYNLKVVFFFSRDIILFYEEMHKLKWCRI